MTLATIPEALTELRAGRPVIVVDNESRENEGDVVIAAELASQEWIAWTVKNSSGFICAPMTNEIADRLELPVMVANNEDARGTNYTVSVDAANRLSTGISAADRARTISVAIDGSKGRQDIVTPGHVFPLVAKDGGVLVRTGHTEAAVDVARLAGLNPSGVICEVMKDDGTMARLDDLIPFAQKHKMKIGTIRDLIAYRRRHDHLVERRAEANFTSKWGGDWKAIVFYNRATESEQIVLQKGHVDPDKPTLVRMHQLAPLTDLFAKIGERSGVLARSMEIIAEEGSGLIVMLPNFADNRDWLTKVIRRQAGEHVEGMDELRNYGVGAQILAELGVHDMVLLTNTHHSLVALEGYDLAVVGERKFDI